MAARCWCPFAQIGGGGALVTVSANKGGLDSWRRRAQALVSLTGADLAISRELLGVKLDGQACVAQRLGGGTAMVRLARSETVPVWVAFERLAADALEAGTFGDFATAERVAARYYWRCWHDLVPHYTAWWAEWLPEHWRTAGTRNVAGQPGQSKPCDAVYAGARGRAGSSRPRRRSPRTSSASTPGIALMHTSRRYQRDLISDLMEPARPVADAIVLDLLESRWLDRGDVYETRDGRCRLGSALAHELAHAAPRLYDVLQPHCFRVVQTLITTTKGKVPSRARRVGVL